MLVGSYFVARIGIAAGVTFLALASAALALPGRQGSHTFAMDLAIAGYAVSLVSVIVYIGVLHA